MRREMSACPMLVSLWHHDKASLTQRWHDCLSVAALPRCVEQIGKGES